MELNKGKIAESNVEDVDDHDVQIDVSLNNNNAFSHSHRSHYSIFHNYSPKVNLGRLDERLQGGKKVTRDSTHDILLEQPKVVRDKNSRI